MNRFAALCVTATTVATTLTVVAGPAQAATDHHPVLTSSTNSNGNYLQYSENYDNSRTAPHQAVVSILAIAGNWGGIHFPDPFDGDVYGSEIYAFHYTGPECLTGNQRQCWHVDAGLAQYGSSVSWAPEPPGEPCEFVVWYAWNWTAHSPVFGGNTC